MKSELEKRMIHFLGYCKNRGATEEEIKTIAKTIDLIRKYLTGKDLPILHSKKFANLINE